MRLVFLIATTSLLAACGGAGSGPIASAPGPQGGSSTGSTQTHSFVHPTEKRTYVGVGGVHSYDYLTDARECCNQQGETYAGNATTVRNSTIEISYDPRDAIYTLSITDPLAGSSTSTRFQDPAARTDFDGKIDPQWGTPNLGNPNVTYLQSGGGSPTSGDHYSGTGTIDPGTNTELPSGAPGSSYTASSLFLLKPGSETQYVTYGGYVRNNLSFAEQAVNGELISTIDQHFERGAFAFGELTAIDSVPKTGTGSFSGSMLATMIFNPTLDGQVGSEALPSYFQWIHGTANIAIDFAAAAFDLTLAGTVTAPQIDYYTSPTEALLLAGAQFNAAGKGTINLKNFGGFKGEFLSAGFQNPNGGASYAVNVTGSSIDGAFYGPNGQEVGGGFRIVGGNPDERVDIIGAFTGK